MKRVVRAVSPEIVWVAGGDSSPSSAESTFRELDDVFLQTQTRIWLGEVLHIRFDEDTAIADLLADGELLFQVSKVVWKMLLKKHVELKHSKVFIHERTSYGKSSGKYMPYPKVDSFLKICQILGLTGIDLFSPPDVVEKRDVRRVCMCIRSLSKKARSRNLNVPDFDIVTYTIAMPTNLVNGIRRNLEQSQYSYSSSSGSSSSLMDPKEFYRQKSPGAQSHCDSYSEPDEAESAFTEFEFQSPLSNALYDVTNFSDIIGQESPEGNLVLDGDVHELQTQFRLDDYEHIDAVVKPSIRNSVHEPKITLHCKPLSSDTNNQIYQGAETCYSNTEGVVLPLINSGNIIGINNTYTSSYQNSASTEAHFPCDLDVPHVVGADEDFITSSSTMWRKGLENNLAKCSSSDSNIILDQPKEAFISALMDHSTKVQTVSSKVVYDGLNNMESSNNNNILEFQDMAQKEMPQTAKEVNAEGKKEKSCISTLQMDHSHSGDDEVSPPGNYMKIQADSSDLIFCRLHDDNDRNMSAECSSLTAGSVDLGTKDVQNGPKMPDANEAEVTEVYSSSISWEDKYANSDYRTSTVNFSQGNSPKEVNACDSILDISAKGHVSTPDKEDIYVNEDNDLFTYGKHDFRVEIDTSDTVPTVCFDNNTCDNGISHAERNVQDIGSNGTFSSAANREIISLKIPGNPQLDIDCLTISSADSDSVKNDQVLSNMLDQSWSSSMHCKDFLNRNPKTDSNGNECKVCSSKDCYALEEGDHSDASTCFLEMDADEQVNNPDMSTIDEGMTSSCLLIEESKLSNITTLDASDNQLMTVPSCCPTEGAMKMKTSEETGHSYDVYKNPIEVKEKYNEEESSIQGSSSADDLSIPRIRGREPAEQIHVPKVNDIADRKVPTPACIMEREIGGGAVSDANGPGEVLIGENFGSIEENEEAYGNGKIKESVAYVEKLVPELKLSGPTEKADERAKGKKVLKSVAGAMTILGALFLYHHVRQRKEKKRNAGAAGHIAPRQNGKASQELPEQKRAERVKPDAIYPGERLKF